MARGVIFDWLLAWGVFALQGLGGWVIGGRFLVACSWWFWRLVYGRLARGLFWDGGRLAVLLARGDIGAGLFSACFGRGGFGSWIVWRVVFVVWCVTGFGGWLARWCDWLVLAVGAGTILFRLTVVALIPSRGGSLIVAVVGSF